MAQVDPAAPRALENRRLLLVEDDFSVAGLVREMLEAEGARVIGPIGSLREVLALLDSGAGSDPATLPDLALLDIDLRGEKSYPAAERLEAAGIPFVFASGCDPDALDRRWRRHPRCEKPFRRRDLIAALAAGARPAAAAPAGEPA